MPFCRRLPGSLDGVTAWGQYEGMLREVILRMKHRNNWALTKAVAQLFANRAQEAILAWEPHWVVPVPMHWMRRWIRGVNSPEILAGQLAKAVGVPVAEDLVVRHRRTRLQRELSPTARKKNIDGAFRVQKPEVVAGSRIVLVDDVLTTGATCGELARVLKQAGASGVWAAVVARTPPRTSL